VLLTSVLRRTSSILLLCMRRRFLAKGLLILLIRDVGCLFWVFVQVVDLHF
jgi:hypothetical protein